VRRPDGHRFRRPGYRYKDELPTKLPPAPTDPTGERKVYARGLLAMANAGPDTNGSQFFLHTLDRIAAGGVAPTPEDPAPVAGAPAIRTEILLAVPLL
jgi:peptidyl-prolyl cis-trans isomerase B (cyclophilin B)